MNKKAILNGNVISNVAVHDSVQDWAPLAASKDITDRLVMGIGKTYNERPGTGTHSIIIDGNSLAAAGKGTYNGLERGIVAAGFATSDYVNVAVNGRTTTVLCTTQHDVVTSLYYPSLGNKNILIIWEGTNDLYLNSLTAAAAYAKLKEYCAGAKKIGFKIAIGTVLPRTGSGIDQETRRLALNTLIRDAKTANESWLDYVVDVGADATLGDIATCSNTFYYSDGTHLTGNGYDILVNYFKDAVNALK